MITQDDINEVRVQISRINDLNEPPMGQIVGNARSIEQATYAMSRLLDLIENLSHQLEKQCQTDTCPRSLNPPPST